MIDSLVTGIRFIISGDKAFDFGGSVLLQYVQPGMAVHEEVSILAVRENNQWLYDSNMDNRRGDLPVLCLRSLSRRKFVLEPGDVGYLHLQKVGSKCDFGWFGHDQLSERFTRAARCPGMESKDSARSNVVKFSSAR